MSCLIHEFTLILKFKFIMCVFGPYDVFEKVACGVILVEVAGVFRFCETMC